jgi:hypothetical protein
MEIVGLIVVLVVVAAIVVWRVRRVVRHGRSLVATARDMSEEFERQRRLHDSGEAAVGNSSHGRGVNPRESGRQEEP